MLAPRRVYIPIISLVPESKSEVIATSSPQRRDGIFIPDINLSYVSMEYSTGATDLAGPMVSLNHTHSRRS